MANMRVALLFGVLAPMMFGQWKPRQSDMYDKVPNSRRWRDGTETAKTYRLGPEARVVRNVAAPGSVVLRLPARRRVDVPKLMAVLREGPNLDVFLVATSTVRYPFETRVEVFHGAAGGEARLVH